MEEEIFAGKAFLDDSILEAGNASIDDSLIEAGESGIEAIKGDKGDQGDSSKIIGVSIEMIDPNETAEVTNIGTETEANFHFKIPFTQYIISSEINEGRLQFTLTDGTILDAGDIYSDSYISYRLQEFQGILNEYIASFNTLYENAKTEIETKRTETINEINNIANETEEMIDGKITTVNSKINQINQQATQIDAKLVEINEKEIEIDQKIVQFNVLVDEKKAEIQAITDVLKPRIEALETEIAKKTEKIELIHTGNQITYKGTALTFKQLVDMLKATPNFIYLLSGDWVFLPTYILDEGTVQYIRFGTTIISNNVSKTSNVYVESIDAGNTINRIASNTINNENVSNKVTSISDNPTDIQYPSAKAVKNYIDSLNAEEVRY